MEIYLWCFQKWRLIMNASNTILIFLYKEEDKEEEKEKEQKEKKSSSRYLVQATKQVALLKLKPQSLWLQSLWSFHLCMVASQRHPSIRRPELRMSWILLCTVHLTAMPVLTFSWMERVHPYNLAFYHSALISCRECYWTDASDKLPCTPKSTPFSTCSL